MIKTCEACRVKVRRLNLRDAQGNIARLEGKSDVPTPPPPLPDSESQKNIEPDKVLETL